MILLTVRLPMAEQCPASAGKEFPRSSFPGQRPQILARVGHLKSPFLFPLVDHWWPFCLYSHGINEKLHIIFFICNDTKIRVFLEINLFVKISWVTRSDLTSSAKEQGVAWAEWTTLVTFYELLCTKWAFLLAFAPKVVTLWEKMCWLLPFPWWEMYVNFQLLKELWQKVSTKLSVPLVIYIYCLLFGFMFLKEMFSYRMSFYQNNSWAYFWWWGEIYHYCITRVLIQ